jgi:hypothetical protein
MQLIFEVLQRILTLTEDSVLLHKKLRRKLNQIPKIQSFHLHFFLGDESKGKGKEGFN